MSIPKIPSRRLGNQDPAHVMDFPSLNLGYKPCSKTPFTLVDLDITVYGLEEIKGGDKPVAVVIVAHGWANNAAQMENMCHGLVGEMTKLGARRTRDVIVVTYDQRNHGTRKLKKDTLSYNKNPLRLVAMATTLTGAVEDHQLIMDMLEDYVFPLGERKIVEFMCTGVSLGGHAVWRLMKTDPRVRIAVPIISVPPDSLNQVHTTRFRADGTIGTDKMYFPKATREFYEGKTAPGTFKDKYILALCGGVDEVVPPSFGNEDWEKVRADARATDQWIQPGIGHICTPEMVARAAEWFARWGLGGGNAKL
ncbi:uncharacterized protein CcaverHIS019_0307420 [Cutaneotrichosporon cavernicola]|uniref:Alpha/beta-hydrolase n=1 Tax=Cutaneotrichosporon cavernicola TaxID=279322 RepID=A0AA48I7F0_9TREE|nr:uncharacterized protein CcaverHIS019_0307420 [Cutaneotrichosporon cavernicola]BEI90672.1 hypothetical protein CcaverHIS019_0307420 [Cutaneotrichosporon cavernicola]BEI98450.1 hypothetical protein CcaverHIS631_0307490 [Cutaneotrichosporon cavernicola]BEJ06223.1 hypothetical protein CcaverHIS641_0307450 [Cutaneotrichosporon cavernicola]